MTKGHKLLVALIAFTTVVIGSVVAAEGVGQPPGEFSAPEEDQPPSTPEPSADHTISVALHELNVFLTASKPQPVSAPVVTAPASTTPTAVRALEGKAPDDKWDLLAQCEAGGNWAASGNGFGGGLQFMHQSSYSTWLSFGGAEFAANPWDASREQQIVVAARVLASSGWKAWPGCSRKLGWL